MLDERGVFVKAQTATQELLQGIYVPDAERS
jgi:hypothetical protein